MENIKTSMQAFYNNQFKRDADLLNILKQKETKMENNMLRRLIGSRIYTGNCSRSSRD